MLLGSKKPIILIIVSLSMLKSENLVTDPKIQLLGRGLSLVTGLHPSLKKLIEQVCFA